MTRLTGLLCEAALVWIAVTVIALRERKSEVARLVVGARGVTLLALHLRVLAGQRITSLRVIERARDIFPVGEAVALSAIRAEASAVRILMARGAGLRDAHEGPVLVFDSDQRSLGGRNVFRSMAFLALHAGMFPFEVVARLSVVEGCWIPLDERKVEAVVFGVALHAFLAGARPDAIREVQSLMGR